MPMECGTRKCWGEFGVYRVMTIHGMLFDVGISFYRFLLVFFEDATIP